MKNPPSRTVLLLWLSIALYLISMPMVGEAKADLPSSLFVTLMVGWLSLFGALAGGGNIFALIFGIWLSNVMAICAVFTRDSRALFFALCAVLLGLPALFEFPLDVLPGNHQDHAPTLGTYIWFSSYCVLLVYCLLNVRPRPDDDVEQDPAASGPDSA